MTDSRRVYSLVTQIEATMRKDNSDRSAFFTLGMLVGMLSEAIRNYDSRLPNYPEMLLIEEQVSNKVTEWKDRMFKNLGM